MMLILALCIATATAHNWVNSPSRSVNANPVKPSMPSETGQPHLQAIAGQRFQIEWVTGHDSYVYWVMLKAKDKESLLKQSDKILNDYLDNAPAEMQNPPSVEWQKFHRKYNNDSPDNKTPGDGMFTKCHKPGDDLFIERPDVFEGSISGSPGWKSDRFDRNLVYTCQYKQTEACHNGDRRAVYKNPKYPYIIGVHRYRICAGHGARPDVAWFAFPKDTPAGNYFVQYNWRGYYDIVDVQILPGTTPLAKTYGDKPPKLPKGTPAEYRRIDHCAFPEAQVVQGCHRMRSDASVGACKTACDWTTIIACSGVAVVPLENPDTVYKHFRNVSFIPYDVGTEGLCPKATLHKNAPAGTKVCYPLQAREATQTAGRYVVSDDPDDPIFYSTCYVRIRRVVLANGPPPEEEEEEEEEQEPEFLFREKCISCETQQLGTVSYANPIKELDYAPQEQCIHCGIDGPKLADLAQPRNWSIPIKYKEVILKKTCDNERADDSKPEKVLRESFTCENKKTSCTKRLMYPGSGRRAYVDEHDCREMIKADPLCDDKLMFRHILKETTLFWQHECNCWRKEPACCGPCVERGDGNSMIQIY